MSLSPVVRIGDPGSHVVECQPDSSTCKADGIYVCRNGDTYDCPIHGPNPISCSASVKVDELDIALAGIAIAECGATITNGSSDVTAN